MDTEHKTVTTLHAQTFPAVTRLRNTGMDLFFHAVVKVILRSIRAVQMQSSVTIS